MFHRNDNAYPVPVANQIRTYWCGRDNGRPGLCTDYSPNHYAAFLIDPDGNNVEAVCLT